MSISVQEPRVTVAAHDSAPPARRWDAAAVALVAVVLSAAGAARPSLWFDEAATISAGTRTVPELWRMLSNIDAVHGLYYLVMHGWFAVFPATEFLSRFSSALMIGVAAAGVVVLGKRLSTRRVAVTAGLIFAVLPRVTWAGMETRSYAATMAVAVWLTVLCVAIARRRRGSHGWWVAYAALVAVAALLNVFLVLLVPVHAAVVLIWGRRRSSLVWWGVGSAAAVAAVVPFLLFSQTQLFQVRWISPIDAETVGMILQEQYSDLSLPFAVVSWSVIGIAGIVGARRLGGSAGGRSGRLVVLSLVWMALPTATLLLYSLIRSPIYYPRYLSFTAPAMALLLGLSAVTLGRTRRGIALVLVVLAAAAAPNYVAQRGPYAKADMDYSAVADVIGRYAAPGDCLVMDNSTTWKPGPIRPLLAARPAAFQKLHDYGRGLTAVQRNRLWDSHIAIWAWADKMPECPALWTVTERDPARPDHQRGTLDPGPRLQQAMAYQVPSRFGFRVVERWQFSFAQVTKSVR